MAGRKRQCPDHQLEISQILVQAKHRWLQPAEVCGSFLLYNRKVLRSFRKDGYKWKKKEGGKALKEGNERLKVGVVEMIRCYYAHGEENENLQRRCYWFIEKSLSDTVLVHYRDVKNSADCKESCSSEVSINLDTHLDTTYHASTSFPGEINVDELRKPKVLKNLYRFELCMNKELGDLSDPQISSPEDHLNPVISEN